MYLHAFHQRQEEKTIQSLGSLSVLSHSFNLYVLGLFSLKKKKNNLLCSSSLQRFFPNFLYLCFFFSFHLFLLVILPHALLSLQHCVTVRHQFALD